MRRDGAGGGGRASREGARRARRGAVCRNTSILSIWETRSSCAFCSEKVCCCHRRRPDAHALLGQLPEAHNFPRRMQRMAYQVERADQLERTWLLLSQVHIESGKDDLLLVSTSRRLVDMLLDVDSLAGALGFSSHRP